MLSVYPACFFKENNGYTVIFPDLNGLATCGETLDRAMAAAVDCLAGYLYMLKREGDVFPQASGMENIDINEIALELEIDCVESFVNIITVDVEEYAKVHFEKSVKKTLSIPAWLNSAAIEQNINFSKVLQEALIVQLQRNL